MATSDKVSCSLKVDFGAAPADLPKQLGDLMGLVFTTDVKDFSFSATGGASAPAGPDQPAPSGPAPTV